MARRLSRAATVLAAAVFALVTLLAPAASAHVVPASVLQLDVHSDRVDGDLLLLQLEDAEALAQVLGLGR